MITGCITDPRNQKLGTNDITSVNSEVMSFSEIVLTHVGKWRRRRSMCSWRTGTS